MASLVGAIFMAHLLLALVMETAGERSHAAFQGQYTRPAQEFSFRHDIRGPVAVAIAMFHQKWVLAVAQAFGYGPAQPVQGIECTDLIDAKVLRINK